jgi:hypothetical protein
MRSYHQLFSFMCDLGDGIQDHLPEEMRTEQLAVEEIVNLWVDKNHTWQSGRSRRIF